MIYVQSDMSGMSMSVNHTSD